VCPLISGSAIADDAFSLNSSKFGDYSSYFIYPIELEINLKHTTNAAREHFVRISFFTK
jgi:hypothetical protein